ncbi:MAG: hypothetical protein L6Q45_17235 [Anaerolineales bacterium]|nr:hypothetical protein [Anaerolineales bacterium]MCK6584344.1 hypothetical protein [Anaerolineales bacterium]
MSWIQDLVNPQARQWEEFYRNRWQHVLDHLALQRAKGVVAEGFFEDGGRSWHVISQYDAEQSSAPIIQPENKNRPVRIKTQDRAV